MGFKPDQNGIFGKNLLPTSPDQQFAWNLGQTVPRAESESHLLPADWPTFSQLDAWARVDPSPLFRSALRKFNPGVPDIMAEAQVVTKALGWETRVIGGTYVGWGGRGARPPPPFSLFDEGGDLPRGGGDLMLSPRPRAPAVPGGFGQGRRD